MDKQPKLPTERRQQILSLLEEQGTVSIGDLSRAFGVSEMTVHRDLDQLAASGHLRKVRGGAVPAAVPATKEPVHVETAAGSCQACHMPLRPQTQVTLHLADGSQRRTCCPHCGLITLAQLGDEVSLASVTDFLHGRTVSAKAAYYVVDPVITICCMPTTIAFQRLEDAERFQRGFGGKVQSLRDATDYIQKAMQIS